METLFDYKNTTLFRNLDNHLRNHNNVYDGISASVAEPLFVRSSRISDDKTENAMIHAYIVTVVHNPDGSATQGVETLTAWIDDDWDVLSCERIALHFV